MNVKSLTAALAACLMVAGCSDDAKKTYGNTYSLTVFAYDAVTGAPITSAALAAGLVLYEDSDKVQPVVLDTTLAGAVIFKDVPADYATKNKVYPIFASVAGYQAFQGEVTFATHDNNVDQGMTGLPTDDLFSQVGYIHLWPVGFHAPDYTFTVLFNGKPVPNAAVKFDMGDQSSGAGNNQNHGVIAATYYGLIPSLTGTTDANGNVTFLGANLMLGASYDFEVEPIVFEGVQLASGSDNGVIVGTDDATRVVSLSNTDLVPGANKYGLYVKSISNSVEGQVSSGTLTIVLSRAVVLHTSTTAPTQLFDATQTSSGALNLTTPVNATLSADGLTLTLSPSWTTNPNGADRGSTITYNDGSAFLTVVGYPADTFGVFGDSLPGLSLAAGPASNYRTVTLVAP